MSTPHQKWNLKVLLSFKHGDAGWKHWWQIFNEVIFNSVHKRWSWLLLMVLALVSISWWATKLHYTVYRKLSGSNQLQCCNECGHAIQLTIVASVHVLVCWISFIELLVSSRTPNIHFFQQDRWSGAEIHLDSLIPNSFDHILIPVVGVSTMGIVVTTPCFSVCLQY